MSSDKSSNSKPDNPYELLGVKPGDSFEVIKAAKEKKLREVGDDPNEKVKIELSYDSILMNSLKQRQKGNVSNEAINASKREESNLFSSTSNAIGSSLLTTIKSLGKTDNNVEENSKISIIGGQGLSVRLSLGLLAIVLLLTTSERSTDLILSLSSIGVFLSQLRRGRKFIKSLLWTLGLLLIGLLIGQIIVGQDPSTNLELPFSNDQIESLPALFLLWLGSLFLG
tara:strand:+ start:1143 stop:1820 length:678 start_codon:yes stop_codon:yes gene_type:complete